MSTNVTMSFMWRRRENRRERDSVTEATVSQILEGLPVLNEPLSVETLMTEPADIDTGGRQASGAGSRFAND